MYALKPTDTIVQDSLIPRASYERVRTQMPATVEHLFFIPRKELPSGLSSLPALLRRTQSRSCRNASDVLSDLMIPAENGHQARAQTYRHFRDGVLARSSAEYPHTHSIVVQIIAIIEQLHFDEGTRMAMLGVITAKSDDRNFLVALRDQFQRS